MPTVIIVYLTADDDGNSRDEDTGLRASGLTWRRAVVLYLVLVLAVAGLLEEKKDTRNTKASNPNGSKMPNAS
ncbi:hypothetical protein M422DRAFT_35257 [Sphaerobolus stellatus SS14]|uniref:Uncharacterized protein n=1 Tax=Sphaerobolus stellatus (strain SS14) TaxID=990650 RepID=A0A0C9UXG6_SPHS4|nr:hypothetical protein M422DRAFT_35257 [Sphaerobolus stellatus SS14]